MTTAQTDLPTPHFPKLYLSHIGHPPRSSDLCGWSAAHCHRHLHLLFLRTRAGRYWGQHGGARWVKANGGGAVAWVARLEAMARGQTLWLAGQHRGCSLRLMLGSGGERYNGAMTATNCQGVEGSGCAKGSQRGPPWNSLWTKGSTPGRSKQRWPGLITTRQAVIDV